MARVDPVHALESILSRGGRLPSKIRRNRRDLVPDSLCPAAGRTEARLTLGGSPAVMSGPRVSRLQANVWPAPPLILLGLVVACTTALAQDSPRSTDSVPGQIFPVTEPINDDTVTRIRAAARQLVDRNASAENAARPILVFEFLPGETAPGSSGFGACYELAKLISRDLGGAYLTVAYVPQPLRGYAVLPAIACTEIVMGSSASLGPITPDGETVDEALRGPVRFLAMRQARDPDLLLGMLDRDADLRLVRTADKTVHYKLPENINSFRQKNDVIDDQPAWDGGQRGVLTAERAREEGFCKRTAESSAEVAGIYRIGSRSAIEDPTLGQAIRPVWIKLEGPLDNVMVSYLTRSVEQARQQKEKPARLANQQPRRHRDSRRRPGRQDRRDQGHENCRLY